ncbi:MAG: VOC family protein [Chloroflexi bacterium]|nr:MAG: VOC family protein [Chloroflexota bacterium]
MAHPVTHFEINARDAKAVQRFYQDLFGWGVDTNNPQDYGMVDTQASGRGINGGIGPSQDGRSWLTFYVDTPDPAKTLAKAEKLGARTIMPPMDMGVVTYALFADPEGNVVGLVKSQAQQGRSNGSARRSSAARNGASTRRTAAKRTTRKAASARKPAAKRRTTRARTRRA